MHGDRLKARAAHLRNILNGLRVIKEVKTSANRLEEVLAVIEILELVARDNKARQGRERKLNTRISLLIKCLVLEERVEILDDALAIEASHLMSDRASVILVAIGNLELIRLKILANTDRVIALVARKVVDEVDVNRGLRVSHFSGMLPYTAELHSIFAKSLLLSVREGTYIIYMLYLFCHLNFSGNNCS